MLEKREGHQSDAELLDWLMQEVAQVRKRIRKGEAGASRKRVEPTNTGPAETETGGDEAGTPVPPMDPSAQPVVALSPGHRNRRRRMRRATSILAPGHTVTTIPGSLYDSIFRALACVGQLALHDSHFREFGRCPSAVAARQLLDAIGVYRRELEIKLTGDDQFKSHRRKRTIFWQNRAAAGIAKAQAVVSNPAIWGPRGWEGDVDEAISILSGCNKRAQYRASRNLAIARRARLTFAMSYRGQDQVLYLYPIQHRLLFERARRLACE
ncbi:MAG: hypothetical protein M5U26_30365 [Planctomycetota bacterium]|nr:hypothetical protein [Planctomycetota bacterium]